MSLRVTFDIFSGRPNPVVVLDGSDATTLLQKLQPTAKLAGAQAVEPPESFLGYRGLIVEQIGPGVSASVPQRLRIVDGKAFAPATAYRVPDDVEDFVIAHAQASHQASVPADVLAEIRTQAIARRSGAGPTVASTSTSPGPVAACPCGPIYEPQWWNDGATKQAANNCYNYATNYRTDTFAQPGLGTGQMYSFPIASVNMSAAAVRDALVQTNQAACPAEGHLVALFIAPSLDFHWYRLDHDGLWTHKPGPTPVTNKDNAGLSITDPRTANRGIYAQFCGFMVVKHGHIKIR
jgi:hypothetical protein